MLHRLTTFLRIFAFDVVNNPPPRSTPRSPATRTAPARVVTRAEIEGPLERSESAVWSRPQLERFADLDEPEGRMEGLRVKVTPRMLLLLMDYLGREGGRVEIVKAHAWTPNDVDLKFFRRDGEAERPNDVEAVDG